MSKGLYSNEPRPRLCHLRRWPDFVGYGFNLHCEKAKTGQYIGKVDQNSPAESAGLRENDRIVEVNHCPIGNENHKQVVTRIKEGVTRNGTKYPEEVVLLVLDPAADDYYKSKSIIVKSSDANVDKRQSENRNGAESGGDSSHSSDKSNHRTDSPVVRETPPQTKRNQPDRDYKHVTDFTRPTVTNTRNADSPAISRPSNQDYVYPNNRETYVGSTPPASDKNRRKEFPSANTYNNVTPPAKDFYAKPVGNSSSQSSSANGGARGVFELGMSAAEYREKLNAQKGRKRDPRQDAHQMSMKEKHDVVDRL